MELGIGRRLPEARYHTYRAQATAMSKLNGEVGKSAFVTFVSTRTASSRWTP